MWHKSSLNYCWVVTLAWDIGGSVKLFSFPSETTRSLSKSISPHNKRGFMIGEPGVRCATLGHNIGWVLIAINMHKLGNSLSLRFPSTVIFKDVWLALEFSGRHDGRIDNQKCIAKHKLCIWSIDHVKCNSEVLYSILEVNDMVSTYTSVSVFTIIGGIFDSRL